MVAIQPQSRQRCLFKGLLAEFGNGPGKPQADGTGVQVGLIPDAVGTIAEHLGGTVKLNMDFQTDNRFVFHCIKLLPLVETAGRHETASGRHSSAAR